MFFILIMLERYFSKICYFIFIWPIFEAISVKVYASLDNTSIKIGCCKVTAFFNQRIYLFAWLELCKVHMIKIHLFEYHSKAHHGQG